MMLKGDLEINNPTEYNQAIDATEEDMKRILDQKNRKSKANEPKGITLGPNSL